LPSSSLRMNVDASSARIVTATTRVTSKGDGISSITAASSDPAP
jgi:hypothetical protein